MKIDVTASAALVLTAFLATHATAAPVYKILHAFKGGRAGSGPLGALVRDSEGNLYGTTIFGGVRNTCESSIPGCGTLFKIDKNGHETVLYRFGHGQDGKRPKADLTIGPDGNLYGTTQEGGTANVGTVFKYDLTKGTESVLYSFCSTAHCTDGKYPDGGVIVNTKGDVYGTTYFGGDKNCSQTENDGCGTVFELSRKGKEAALVKFETSNGQFPSGSLAFDPNGLSMYGITDIGGNEGCVLGLTCGLIYKFDPRTGKQHIVYKFSPGSGGSLPLDGVLPDEAGNLYGIAEQGGNSSCACGVVYKVSNTGSESVLYSFLGHADGEFPDGGLVRDATGNLYGTTLYGGDTNTFCVGSQFGCGVIFKVDASGRQSVVHTFEGTDGGSPLTKLIMDQDGTLYGTTPIGGPDWTQGSNDANGVVFKLTP